MIKKKKTVVVAYWPVDLWESESNKAQVHRTNRHTATNRLRRIGARMFTSFYTEKRVPHTRTLFVSLSMAMDTPLVGR